MAHDTTVRIAWSKNKHGFTAYSHELVESRYPQGTRTGRSGQHISIGDTLEEALDSIRAKVRHDWQSLGLAVPPVVECGKVARIVGEMHTY